MVHLNNFNFQLTPSVIYAVKKYESKCKKKIKLVYTAHDSQLVCPNHLMQNPVTLTCCDACLKHGVFQCARRKCIHSSRIKSLLGSFEAVLYKKLKTYQKLDVIICPSKFLKEKLDTDSVLRQKTIVLRNFVDQKIYSELPSKQDYVLYFGRYSQEKGINTLLKVCRELSYISFHFAGSGPLEEEIKKLSNIELRGFLEGDALFREIAGARFAVFPSEVYENFPFAVMEAQMCRTPVIGSDLGGIPELIEEGVTGELFESGNAALLAKKIRDLWENEELLGRYAENCRNVKFDCVEEYTKKIFELYEH